jgi:hypothetical protein
MTNRSSSGEWCLLLSFSGAKVAWFFFSVLDQNYFFAGSCLPSPTSPSIENVALISSSAPLGPPLYSSGSVFMRLRSFLPYGSAGRLSNKSQCRTMILPRSSLRAPTVSARIVPPLIDFIAASSWRAQVPFTAAAAVAANVRRRQPPQQHHQYSYHPNPPVAAASQQASQSAQSMHPTPMERPLRQQDAATAVTANKILVRA